MRAYLKPDVQALLDEYRANRTQYATQLLRGPERISPGQHQTNLQGLQKRAEELEQTLSARSREFRIQTTPVTVEAVQEALPAGAALVEWVRYQSSNLLAKTKAERYGPARYAASILRNTGEPVWLDLGPAEPIDILVATWRDALDRNLDTTNDAARKLDALVMEPVRAHLADARQVILAPDSALNLVPFAALVDERGKYLVERYSFTYVTSGRDLVRLRAHAEAPARSPGMIIADPSYDVPGRQS